jgi:hypothetical protein
MPESVMAYVSSGLAGKIKTRQSLWERIHWERVALLAGNFAIWAVVVGLFT